MISIEVKPLNNIKDDYQNYICSCPKKCKNYVHLDEIGRICEQEALKLGYELVRIVKNIHEPPKVTKRSRSWLISEEQFIKDWFAKGFKYGDKKLIADFLERSYASTVSKIDEMRKEGKL